VRFEDVTLAYRNAAQPALDRVSLEIRPGETVALVGPSGSGKSSLIHLLRASTIRLGRITLDGHDIESLTLESLRRQLSLVSQHVVLFNDTVAANIAYGRAETIAEADIVRAAEAAYAMEFIRQLPQGLATPIGENGAKLSGGQRQRIAIARAILKDAPILLLDEATSALDTESERAVQAALEELMRGRTTIVVAHRLSDHRALRPHRGPGRGTDRRVGKPPGAHRARGSVRRAAPAAVRFQ
jgi:subfamily B ATP-binding cassette protein MsbA